MSLPSITWLVVAVRITVCCRKGKVYSLQPIRVVHAFRTSVAGLLDKCRPHLVVGYHHSACKCWLIADNWQTELFKAVDPTQLPVFWGGEARAPDDKCTDHGY